LLVQVAKWKLLLDLSGSASHVRSRKWTFALGDFQMNQKFVFKIKTSSGGIIDNVLIEARNIDEARYRLQQRYPGCTIMSARPK